MRQYPAISLYISTARTYIKRKREIGIYLYIYICTCIACFKIATINDDQTANVYAFMRNKKIR